MHGCGPEPARFEDAPLGLKFRLIHEKFKLLSNLEMAQYDITYSQMWVLWYLLTHGNHQVRQKDLCEAANVKHPTMVGLIQRLEAKGLVALESDPEDRRQTIVRVTDKAQEIMDQQRAEHDARDLSLVDGMSADEIQQLNTLLEKVHTNLEKAQKGMKE